MRTTITLDEDVRAKLKAEMRKSGRSFKQVVNDFLRQGLNGSSKPAAVPRFKITEAWNTRLKPGLSFDCVEELLERIEGPGHK